MLAPLVIRCYTYSQAEKEIFFMCTNPYNHGIECGVAYYDEHECNDDCIGYCEACDEQFCHDEGNHVDNGVLFCSEKCYNHSVEREKNHEKAL